MQETASCYQGHIVSRVDFANAMAYDREQVLGELEKDELQSLQQACFCLRACKR